MVGFRPELWREFVPGDTSVEIAGFNKDLVGLDGYTMPATQHDLVLWFTSSTYDYIFDLTRDAVEALSAYLPFGR